MHVIFSSTDELENNCGTVETLFYYGIKLGVISIL